MQLPDELPLMFPKSLTAARTTALVQMEDGSIDVSGDIGAVGRLTALPNSTLLLDLKGHQYAGTIIPCNTFMVAALGPTEARVRLHAATQQALHVF
ncbi:MAG: hypothetical protein EOO65_05815 [Methanosarcinales archaeon]|nr:MAG: hypothetical protein EOO65_05815 [Methanosarcinales archaeon]